MKSVLLKRLASFTNIYLVLGALSVLVWLNKWDSEESTQELTDLIALQNVAPLELSKLTCVINQKALERIAKHDTGENTNIAVISQRFTHILNQYGISYQDCDPCDSSFGYNPALFSLVTVTPLLKDSTIIGNPAVTSPTQPSEALIGTLAKKVSFISAQTQIEYVTAFDETLLKFKLDSIVFADHSLREHISRLSRKDSLDIARTFFSKRQLMFAFKDTLMYMGFFYKEGKWDLSNLFLNSNPIIFPIRTRVSTETPSIISLLDKPELNSMVNMENYTSFIRVKENYPNILLSEAIKHLSEESIRAYKSISIFGFEFSKRRLPWVFGFFCFVAGSGILMTMIQAEKKNLKLFTDMDGDQITNLFLEDSSYRAFMWCWVPLFIMYSSFPNMTTSFMDNIEAYTIAGFVTLMNIMSYRTSIKL